MKKQMPIIVSIAMLALLLVVTLLLDRGIGRERLEQVATIPDFVPPQINTLVDQENPDSSDSLAPDFTVTDAQGNKVSLSQMRGKTVVINFWASWAPPSQRELAMYEQAYQDYKDEVNFMIINTTSDNRETKEAADKMIADGGFTFPVYYDLDASAANAYNVISLPTSFFIDANGKAVAYAAGEIARYHFEQGLQACEASLAQSGSSIEPTEATESTQTESAEATQTTEIS